MSKDNTPIRIIISSLDVNQTAEFPLERMNSVRVTACTDGLVNNKIYKTRCDRQSRKIKVTRIQ